MQKLLLFILFTDYDFLQYQPSIKFYKTKSVSFSDDTKKDDGLGLKQKDIPRLNWSQAEKYEIKGDYPIKQNRIDAQKTCSPEKTRQKKSHIDHVLKNQKAHFMPATNQVICITGIGILAGLMTYQYSKALE